MQRLLIILLVLTSIVTISSGGRVVCYFTGWSKYKTGDNKFEVVNVDPTLCDQIIYAFVAMDDSGNVKLLDDWEETLLEIDALDYLKNRNPDLKVLVSMGGFDNAPSIYSQVAADPYKRFTMGRTVLNLVGEFVFDGFELDWEYPGLANGDPENDPVNFVTLLGELKSLLEDRNIILSVSVTAQQEIMNISYPDVRAISDNVDQINVMTYDQSYKKFVRYDQTREQELNVVAGIRQWINRGADPAKLNLGMSTYGRRLDIDGTDYGIIGYNEICQLGSDWEYAWDDEQQLPNIDNGTLRIVYEDTQSLGIKAEIVNELEIGGVAVWSLDTDDFHGRCGEFYPLLKAVNNKFN